MAILSPEILRSGRRLPCAHLAELATRKTPMSERISVVRGRALLVAAFQTRVLEALEIPPPPAGSIGLTADLFDAMSEPVEISALTLQVFGDDDQVALTIRRGFEPLLKTLSEGLLAQILTWAPPVVARWPQTGKQVVVANQLVAAVQLYLHPSSRITAYESAARATHHSNLSETGHLVRTALGELVALNIPLIARIADTVEDARFLTGLGRTRVYELRSMPRSAA